MKLIWASDEYATNRLRCGRHAGERRTVEDADDRERQDDWPHVTKGQRQTGQSSKRSRPLGAELGEQTPTSRSIRPWALRRKKLATKCAVARIGDFTPKAMAKAMKSQTAVP